jgi:hypothetical protein
MMKKKILRGNEEKSLEMVSREEYQLDRLLSI